MTKVAYALAGFRRLLLGVAALTVVASVALAATDPGLGWVVLPALVGGAVIAGVLFALHAWHNAAPVPDGAQRGELAGVMNISHVRVAGLGGLALVLVSWLVALQYQLLTAAVAAGAVGGAIGAVTMIVHRRRHPAVGDDLHVTI